MLGGVFVFGLAANGLSVVQSLVTTGFAAGVLTLAWLWQLTFRRAETAPPLTFRQRVWNATLFIAYLGMLALVWWYVADRTEHTQQRQPPAINPWLVQEDLPADDNLLEPPPRNAPAGP